MLGALDFFWCDVGEFLIKNTFVVVGGFAWPGVQVADFNLSFFVDENVGGSDITDLAVDRSEIMGCLAQAEQEIPDFFLTEVLINFESVFEFFMKDVRIVIKFDLR